MRRLFAGLSISVITLLLCFIILEFVIRFSTGSLSEWRNYATDPGNLVKVTSGIDFDSEIGWVLKKDRPDLGFGPWGNRVHKAASGASGTPILAVGDSFTYGSEVEADESWPAQLEQKIRIPIINAGVGGYGIDQAVLLAERLARQIKPRMILLSFIPNDIARTKMSIFSGATKPFYRIVNGKLQPQNLPLEPYKASVWFAGAKAIFGYSKLIDWVTQRVGINDQWRAARFEIKYENADDIGISCAFMERLSKIGPPAVVIGQHGWTDFTPDGKYGVDLLNAVLDCAKQAGIRVVRTWPPLRAALPDQLSEVYNRYYVSGTGHMTKLGNTIVAEEIAKALQ
jgi:lysophospholipase L1-like esterase